MSRLSEIMRRVNRSQLHHKPTRPKGRSVVVGVLVVLGLLVVVGVVSLVGLQLAGSRVGLGRMTFEELRQKISKGCDPQWRDGGPVAGGKGTVDLVKERLGQPLKEQVFEGTIYLYYRVREGTAQVKIEGYNPEYGFRGVAVEEINLL